MSIHAWYAWRRGLYGGGVCIEEMCVWRYGLYAGLVFMEVSVWRWSLYEVGSVWM